MTRKLLFTLCIWVGLHWTWTLGQVRINEICPTNLDVIQDENFKFEDWVELYNAGDVAVDLTGYYLSDNVNKPKKWTFPPNALIPSKGFKLVFCSGRTVSTGNDWQANFKLSQSKSIPEVVILSNPSGQVLDSMRLVTLQNGHSLSRFNGNLIRITSAATPLAENEIALPFLRYAATPSIDKSAGFYTGDSIHVTLNTDEPGATIHYTIDGTTPNKNSDIYTSTLILDKTTIVKAISVAPSTDILPSFMNYKTFFLNEDHAFDVISVGSDEIITMITNVDGSLKPHGSIEFFSEGVRKAKSYGEFNRHGQDSWVHAQRSFDFVGRDQEGYGGELKEKFFTNYDRNEFQRIILRASGDDNVSSPWTMNSGSCHMRDAYIQNLAINGGMQLDARRAKKVVVYLNGSYWGIYDIREVPDDHDYTKYNYNQGEYDLEYILTWGWTWEEYGIGHAINNWKQFYDWAINPSTDMSNDSIFNVANDQLDVWSLVDYILVNSYTVCSDWLNYNTGWWRGLNPEGGHKKWGYILWDNDATFGHYINYTNIPDKKATALPCNPENSFTMYDPEGHLKLLRKLLDNQKFKKAYLLHQNDLINSVFSCDNMLHQFDSIVTELNKEMPRHVARWNNSMANWNTNVTKFRNYLVERCNFLAKGMSDCYNLGTPVDVVVDIAPQDTVGTIQLNDLEISNFPWKGRYFPTLPIPVKATVNPNLPTYVFDHWKANQALFATDTTQAINEVQFINHDTLIAIFRDKTTSIQDPNALASFIVYPNLIHQEDIHIEYYNPAGKEFHISLTRSDGSIIRTFRTVNASSSNQSGSMNIPVNELPDGPGMYFMVIDIGGKQLTHKIIKI